MDGRREIKLPRDAKIDISVFIFVSSGVMCSSWSFHNSPISRKVEGARPASWRMLLWLGYRVYPFGMKARLREMSLARKFMTPNGIARRVPGVWVLTFSTYFNCCLFYLNISNGSPPSRYHKMFMPRKGNQSAKLILTLYFFSEGGRFVSFSHISAVNLRCWYTAALFTIFWNIPYQYLISWNCSSL